MPSFVRKTHTLSKYKRGFICTPPFVAEASLGDQKSVRSPLSRYAHRPCSTDQHCRHLELRWVRDRDFTEKFHASLVVRSNLALKPCMADTSTLLSLPLSLSPLSWGLNRGRGLIRQPFHQLGYIPNRQLFLTRCFQLQIMGKFHANGHKILYRGIL